MKKEVIQRKSLRIVASETPFEHEQKDKIFSAYFAITDYYKKYPNPGACHLISSVFYVLLNEQGIDNDLCIGEVKTGDKYFDHSWIEIGGKVFDIAIQHTLDESRNAPVYGGYNLSTGHPHNRVYGSPSPSGFDRDAKKVLNTPFVKYMDAYPHFKEGAWKIVKVIGKELRLKLDLKELKQTYRDTERKLKLK
ncbi:lasso peptide biosynthesis protein [Jeotgalibacillus proteolyticus]|uniref:lasso peptide biosynthesis protein n=1 Tax=Jeotgalibacillus proteolyticus TaxID=2082395 RepID=UPI001431DA33|nr:lasso peptide biosynthesis protein [Jeotgalibacillus proteolyticus]